MGIRFCKGTRDSYRKDVYGRVCDLAQGRREDNMITIRHFSFRDLEYLQTCRYPGLSREEIHTLVDEWETLDYKGRYFEMFAICEDLQIVGSVSLYQHEGPVVSAGPQIDVPYRRRGFARQGVQLALEQARIRGYKIAVAQVREDNRGSVALHSSLGFVCDHAYENSHGTRVLFFMKSIV